MPVRTSEELVLVPVNTGQQTVFEQESDGLNEVAPLIVVGDVENESCRLQTRIGGNEF